ncbi:hypothetical protein TNCV_4951611 [Trichonephila clavipes]|nr:hypothetical protein TNCV_4951611 [Trichonephila clavipes]
MARKRAENREGSLGFPGFVKPVFTIDSKTPREKEKITRAPREREPRTHLKKINSLHICLSSSDATEGSPYQIVNACLMCQDSKSSRRRVEPEQSSSLDQIKRSLANKPSSPNAHRTNARETQKEENFFPELGKGERLARKRALISRDVRDDSSLHDNGITPSTSSPKSSKAGGEIDHLTVCAVMITN